MAYEVLNVIKRILLSFCVLNLTKELQLLHDGKMSIANNRQIRKRTTEVFILFKKNNIKNNIIPLISI